MAHAVLATLLTILWSYYGIPYTPASTSVVRFFSPADAASGVLQQIVVEQASRPGEPVRASDQSLGVELTALAAIVEDGHTGAVLWEKNADAPRPLASITKLATVMVAYDRIPDMNVFVEIISDDYEVLGTPVFSVGDRVTADDLVAAVLIASDNTAANALVRASGISNEQFVEEMNSKARALNLPETRFVDSTGLSPGNVSTAREVAALARAAFERPEILASAGLARKDIRTTQGTVRTLYSTNLLHGSFLDIVAAKTGYVDESGFNLVARVSDKGMHEVIGVVLGSSTNDDRFHDFKMMAYWAWTNFEWPKEEQ